jgi:acetyl esterase
MARDSGGPAIAFTALIYPAVDMTAKGGSMDDNATGYFLDIDSMDWFMNQYLDEADKAEAKASPLLHADLSGPARVLHRHLRVRPLRDQGEAYGDALRANGVHVVT